VFSAALPSYKQCIAEGATGSGACCTSCTAECTAAHQLLLENVNQSNQQASHTSPLQGTSCLSVLGQPTDAQATPAARLTRTPSTNRKPQFHQPIFYPRWYRSTHHSKAVALEQVMSNSCFSCKTLVVKITDEFPTLKAD
jgi:hypothetical protein